MSSEEDLALFDSLNDYYNTQYNEAEKLLEAGKEEEALPILTTLYQDPTISLFLRAKVNYCLAVYGESDNPRYMKQCLEMIHVYCDSGREETADVRALEELAVQFIQHYYMFLAKEVGENESEDGEELVDAPEMNNLMEETDKTALAATIAVNDLIAMEVEKPEDVYIGMYPGKPRWYELPGATFQTLHS